VNRTRVLVADSFPIFRSGVCRLLSANTDFEVVEAADLEEVLAFVDEGCPDIALVDLELAPSGGLEAIARITERCSCHSIVWSCEPSCQTVLEAIRAGASGYLEKSISTSGLVRALRGIEQGQAALSRDLATQLVEALHGREQRRDAFERAAVLSVRERQVLDLVARGARNRQIAEALVISEFTVKRHMQNILRKLGLPSRGAAASFYTAAFAPAADGGSRTRDGAA
jgi:two-component system, NarL family, nitrate/nitrite response regulator NarL